MAAFFKEIASNVQHSYNTKMKSAKWALRTTQRKTLWRFKVKKVI